jgi:hypothetical protein
MAMAFNIFGLTAVLLLVAVIVMLVYVRTSRKGRGARTGFTVMPEQKQDGDPY